MPCSSVWLFGFSVTCYDKDNLWQHLWAWKLERNETLHIHIQHGKLIAACAISKSPTTTKLLSAMNARSKSTVNSSQRRQTWWSTHHTILRCDELPAWRIDWFPYWTHKTVPLFCRYGLTKSWWFRSIAVRYRNHLDGYIILRLRNRQ